MLASFVALAVQAAGSPPLPPHLPRSGPATLVMWLPGEVRCADGAAPSGGVRRPANMLGYPALPPDTLTARFDIDASGRPLSIVQDRGVPWFVTDDVDAAIAASRFPAGAPRVGCTATYTRRTAPLSEAPVEELASYTIQPHAGALPEAGWARLRGTGSCWTTPRPQPLNRAYPDFDRLPATPGVRDWSLIGYDTDATGRPRNLRVMTGTGNAALDTAASDAVARSRFTGGARTGCSYPYWRTPATLAAPPSPPVASLRPAGATCPEKHGWATAPAPFYPETFRRRSIEGWAVLSYDVASWGEPGNVRVLAAQPAAAFGLAAERGLKGARGTPAKQGLTGCVDTVRFLIGAQAGQPIGAAY